MNIEDLNKNNRFKIKYLCSDGEIGKRLSSMGFTKDTEGLVVRSALMGDPIQVKILGYNVSIRKTEARCIEVEKLD